MRPSIVRLLLLASAASSAVVKPEPSLNQPSSPTVLHKEDDRLDLVDLLSDPATTNVTSPDANAADAACSGKTFGYDLNLQSCKDALRLIPPGREQLSFAMRYNPVGAQSDVKLPYRWLSRR